jgi:hypothetical protein
MSLPDLPEGVAWQQNTDTKEWTLVTADPDAKSRRKYVMERTTAWNAKLGREQLTVRMRPVVPDDQNQSRFNPIKPKKTLGGSGGDDETVATETTGMNENDDFYFNEDFVDGSDDDEKDRQDQDQDDNNPPEPVLGVDYIIHTVLPSDTFQGLVRREDFLLAPVAPPISTLSLGN